jgi:hypothetical protein
MTSKGVNIHPSPRGQLSAVVDKDFTDWRTPPNPQGAVRGPLWPGDRRVSEVNTWPGAAKSGPGSIQIPQIDPRDVKDAADAACRAKNSSEVNNTNTEADGFCGSAG